MSKLSFFLLLFYLRLIVNLCGFIGNDTVQNALFSQTSMTGNFGDIIFTCFQTPFLPRLNFEAIIIFQKRIENRQTLFHFKNHDFNDDDFV